MELNTSQLDFCNNNFENTSLLAPAGCGKTFSILERCKFLLSQENDDKILIFTFTRVARDELKDRILSSNDFLKFRKNIRVETLNEYGNNYLRKNFTGLSIKQSKSDKYFLVKNILRPIWSKHQGVSKIFAKKNSNTFYNEIIDIFDALKSIGFLHLAQNSEILWENFENHLKWLEENNLQRYFNGAIYKPLEKHKFIDTRNGSIRPFIDFWSKSCKHMWDSAVISLVDQKYWCWIKLSEKYKLKVLPKPNQYRHILVDEFQDINPIDLFLIKELKRINESSLSIVGDDDQAIYEWRGSTPEFILTPEKYFDTDFAQFKLDTNYRSAKNIIEHSMNLISNNKNRIIKSIKPEREFNAKVEVINYLNQSEYLKFLLELCKEVNTNNSPQSLAIISRKKSQLIPIQIMLTSEEIPYYAKEDLNILLSNAFNDLKKVLEIIANKNDRRSTSEVVKEFLHLCSLVKRYKLHKNDYSRIIRFLLKGQPKKILDCLPIFIDYEEPLKGENKDGEMTMQFYNAISTILNSKTVKKAILAIGENLQGLQKHYVKSEEDIFYKDPPFSFIVDYAEKYGSDFWGFIDHIQNAMLKMEEQTDNEEIDKEYKLPIHLMTALRAKGKEFENVVILDVNQGIWPNKLNDTPEDLEQERRIFYVAVTRAKKRLTLITTDLLLGNRVPPSQYIEEMGL